MKRYSGIFILAVVVCLSSCASNADNDTQVSSHADETKSEPCPDI